MINCIKIQFNDNRLSGGIPDLSALPNLQELYLHNNQLTGGIPDFSTLKNCYAIYLNGNHLTGGIPDLSVLKNIMEIELQNNQLTGDIPPSITSLPDLEYLDPSHNMLTASDPAVVSWFEEVVPTWHDTQTIPPGMIGPAAKSSTSIQVSWTPIRYTGDGGFYRILYSTTQGGPYTAAGETADKTANGFLATGLREGALYYFVVATFTLAHGEQRNDLTSALSEEVSAVATPQ
ncbi:MAG: hypothetical protein GY869_03310 [Planctomycetes bacterium]|nr:hypothetical protein [Planctomycetota bacterium]